VAIDAIQKHLELQLAPTASIHAVLMDVLGVGVLLLGKSGIGKSEAALDLIMRGHRLVADDLVEVRRTSGEVLVGWASELIKHHMEVRGLGIINIKDMFGVAAVRDEKTIAWAWTRWSIPFWRCRCRCCASRSARAATSAR
jgi:HPr kinase/phosphorylase